MPFLTTQGEMLTSTPSTSNMQGRPRDGAWRAIGGLSGGVTRGLVIHRRTISCSCPRW